MKLIMKSAVTAFTVLLMSTSVFAQAKETKDLVDVAASSEAHTTLVAAIKAAGLTETLKGKGPYTVFAPTNEAFNKLPEGTVAYLLKAENKAQLAAVLTYHVVAGKFTSKEVAEAIKAGGGKAVLKTVQGGSLTLTIEEGKVKVTDEKGGVAFVSVSDLEASNGVVHVTDAVSLPK